MGEDISSPFWVRVAAVRSVGTRNTLPIRRDILYWLRSRKKSVKLLFSSWWLPEELALLKSSPVAVEDDKKDTVNYWKSVPNQTITHVLFFRIISNLRHHHCMLLIHIFGNVNNCLACSCTKAHCPVEVWDVMCNSLGLQIVLWPKKNILRYSLKQYNSAKPPASTHLAFILKRPKFGFKRVGLLNKKQRSTWYV